MGVPRIWTKTVDSQNRIVLPAELGLPERWGIEEGKPIDCTAIPIGSILGIRLEAKSRDTCSELAREIAEGPEEVDEEDLQRLRHLATRWDVKASPVRSSYRLLLPSEAIDMDLLPGTGGRVTVFAFRQLVELWKAENWMKNYVNSKALLNDRKLELRRSAGK